MTEPLTLARATCAIHTRHVPSIERLGGVYTVERHHIHPLQYEGPDVDDNLIYICPTGHTAVHELLRLHIKLRGLPPWEQRRRYSLGEREVALDGYNRIVASGKLPVARQMMGLAA